MDFRISKFTSVIKEDRIIYKWINRTEKPEVMTWAKVNIYKNIPKFEDINFDDLNAGILINEDYNIGVIWKILNNGLENVESKNNVMFCCAFFDINEESLNMDFDEIINSSFLFNNSIDSFNSNIDLNLKKKSKEKIKNKIINKGNEKLITKEKEKHLKEKFYIKNDKSKIKDYGPPSEEVLQSKRIKELPKKIEKAELPQQPEILFFESPPPEE